MFHLLLKELNPSTGSVILTPRSIIFRAIFFPLDISGTIRTISYASQELWLFGGTIRDYFAMTRLDTDNRPKQLLRMLYSVYIFLHVSIKNFYMQLVTILTIRFFNLPHQSLNMNTFLIVTGNKRRYILVVLCIFLNL